MLLLLLLLLLLLCVILRRCRAIAEVCVGISSEIGVVGRRRRRCRRAGRCVVVLDSGGGGGGGDVALAASLFLLTTLACGGLCALTRLHVVDKPGHGADGAEGVVGERLHLVAQRVRPPHPVQHEVVQDRIVFDQIVELMSAQRLDQVLERE